MKSLVISAFLFVSSFGLADEPRVIEVKTEKIGEAVHWVPAKIEVKPGEQVKFVVKHDLEGGFDFHGFFIPEMKIQTQVNRHNPVNLERTVPKSLKPGEYKVGCHFHPKHVPATLVVKE